MFSRLFPLLSSLNFHFAFVLRLRAYGEVIWCGSNAWHLIETQLEEEAARSTVNVRHIIAKLNSLLYDSLMWLEATNTAWANSENCAPLDGDGDYESVYRTLLSYYKTINFWNLLFGKCSPLLFVSDQRRSFALHSLSYSDVYRCCFFCLFVSTVDASERFCAT